MSVAGCLENVLRKPGRPSEARTPRGAGAAAWVGEEEASGWSAISAVSGWSSSTTSLEGGVVVILRQDVYANTTSVMVLQLASFDYDLRCRQTGQNQPLALRFLRALVVGTTVGMAVGS